MRISQFQIYSQKENTVTNNVLLMLSRLNDLNPNYYNTMIECLNDGDINYYSQPIFTQQRKAGNGIIDGHIEVKPSKILIETKLNTTEFIKKLVQYGNGFHKNYQNQLWHLSSTKFSKRDVAKIESYLQKNYDFKIQFRNLLFAELIENLEGIYEEHSYDSELKLLLEDFKNYCYESKLISDKEFKLLFAPTGFSYKWNKKHKIYYCPVGWHSQEFKFFGLYNNKSVRTISTIETIIIADFDAKTQELTIYNEQENHSDEQIERLRNGLIELNQSHQGCKYYLFPENEFYETNFKKVSKGGIQGYRYKDLRNFPLSDNVNFNNVQEIANQLKNITWR